ncbi:acyl-coenzyme A synthetase/AMP-(fatty) acid ligase/acyl carrier protein [Bradyrhizobium sp. GM24.11]
MQRLGVCRGDHVVAIGRNNAEAVIACLATAAIGATFASCAQDIGVPAILMRFAPLKPKVLFGCLRAEPWDLGVPVAKRVLETAAGLPGFAAIIALDNGSIPVDADTTPLLRLADLLCHNDGDKDGPGWLRHRFNHLLFTMFSSGTTGAPKCIQHGAGGTLLEHVKEHRLHCDLGPGDKLFFQTSCGWMMWNWQLSALASGVEIVLYDGPLEEPDTFWRAQIGELVCANPFPSRPLGFHGDADGTRFHAAYFAQNPGFWTHGDLIEATPRGGWRLHGRSDGVLNVRGIRVGTTEIYSILDDIDEILEAMAVEQQAEEEPGGTRMVLLVVLREGLVLDNTLAKHIRSELGRCGSSAFVPARIAQVEALPVTFNGKRSEAAARDAVNARPVRNRDALQNPACLDAIAMHPVLRAPAGVRVSSGPAPDPAVVVDRERLRQDLQDISERVLGIAPISWSNNLLGFGADSLTLLNLLLEIERYTGHALSLSAFLAAPSIEGLATSWDLGAAEMAAQEAVRSGPRVRAVGPDDCEPVCRFLEQIFPESGIKAASWRRLFEHGWSDRGRGFVLLDGNAIVGFLGAIVARRQVNGEAAFVCNISSWSVHAKYRGWGMALLAALLRDHSLTYTAFTPQPVSWAALLAQRFATLDSHRIVMLPLLHAETLLAPNRPVISFDPAAVRARLTSQQRQIFDDHAPYDCLQLTVSDGPDHAYLVVKRRAQRLNARRLGGADKVLPVRLPYSDILHCSAPELLLRHLERVKLAILRRQRTTALVAEARLFPVRPRGLMLPLRTCYRSSLLAVGDIDRLYSEIVLLPV